MRVRRRRRQANPLVSAIIFFVLGIILAVVAITTDPNNVTCDGQTMSAGDECIHTENGVQTSTNSIDEERQSQETGRIVEAIFAVLFLGAGIFSITRISKARAALKNNVGYTAPQSFTNQQPGAYPPPQGGDYPQQPGNYPPPPNGYPQQPGAYPPPQGGYPQQPGNYPPTQGGYPQQSGAYPPPQGGYPQSNTPSQSGSYPPPPNNYPQQ